MLCHSLVVFLRPLSAKAQRFTLFRLEIAELVRLEGLMILTLSYNNIRAFAETEMDTLGTVRFCLQGAIWEPPATGCVAQ